MGNTIEKSKHTSDDLEEQHGDVPSFFTCEICIEPVSRDRRFKKCSHNNSYCVDCMAKYIEAKLEDYNVSEIKCPGLECHEILDPLSCRSILSTRVFERWCDVLCESTLLQCETAYCPYTDCSAVILNECGGKVRKTKCPNCNKLLCFECKVPWHACYSCNETGEMRDANEVLLGRLMEKKKWKRCPVCRHGVELVSGCPVVTCRQSVPSILMSSNNHSGVEQHSVIIAEEGGVRVEHVFYKTGPSWFGMGMGNLDCSDGAIFFGLDRRRAKDNW
ncbi:hypothetical protein IFM89_028611 [Coptis chinensis]|uniref:RBR-type E3 ubiquitin transferase n=1 Tax=Coptis chinensis TaxID=261450 RepID=A0A835IC12_9MAGN|nr:hypothetical protein IFM89_028611 [Coptis chinensis]